MFKFLVVWLLNPKWVAFKRNDGEVELGLQIWGVIIALYKAEVYYPDKCVLVRAPEKREFGESLHPQ